MTEQELLDAALERAATVSALTQGEVIDLADACVVLADAASPLSVEARLVVEEAAQREGMLVVPHAVDAVVVLTQTCDLQQTSETEYLCQVAPLMTVDESFARQALRGRRPGLAALPWIDSTTVVDLSRITTVERSLLVGRQSLGAPRTPEERLHFAEMLARTWARPALADTINDVLTPFVGQLHDRYDKDSPQGHCMHKVWEVRVEALPDLDAEVPALRVLLILEEHDLPSLGQATDPDDARINALARLGAQAAAEAVEAAMDPVAKREAWTALAECWFRATEEAAADNPAIGSLDIDVMNAEELTYARSLSAPVLDLRYLSTRS